MSLPPPGTRFLFFFALSVITLGMIWVCLMPRTLHIKLF